MGRKSKRLKEYGISYERKRELDFFCLRFSELSQKEKDLIVKAAKEADEAFWESIIENVCKRVPYNELEIYMGKNQFGNLKLLFYKNLNNIKK